MPLCGRRASCSRRTEANRRQAFNKTLNARQRTRLRRLVVRGGGWHLSLGSGKAGFSNNADGSRAFLLSLGPHEWRKVVAGLGLVEPKIVVQYSKQFYLRLGDLEDTKVASVLRPVNVLRTRVIEILGGNDQRRQEDPMASGLRIYVG